MENKLNDELLEAEELEEVEYIEDEVEYIEDDEYYGIPETMTSEELAEEILTGHYSDHDIWCQNIDDYGVLERIAKEAAEEILESYRKPNGKVYIDDYDVFESDLGYLLVKKAEKFEDDEC